MITGNITLHFSQTPLSNSYPAAREREKNAQKIALYYNAVFIAGSHVLRYILHSSMRKLSVINYFLNCSGAI